MCCKAIPRQVKSLKYNKPLGLYSVIVKVNYLIDEGMNVGKGTNCVISLLHHFLGEHNFSEANLLLYANNCCGQNKNQ